MSARRSSADIAADLERASVKKMVEVHFPSPAAHIWRLQAVCNYTGRSRESIRRDMASGTFPKSVKLGQRSVGWMRVEVEQWLKDRMAERA